MVSSHPKSTRIPRVDGFSMGPPDLGCYTIRRHLRSFKRTLLTDINLRLTLSPTKELAFEPALIIPEVEEVILTSDGDDGGALVTMDKGPKQRSRTSPMSLARL